MKFLILTLLLFCISCKTRYIVEHLETAKDVDFENKIDATREYFNLYIFIDKSLDGTKIKVEYGGFAGITKVYDDTVNFEKLSSDYQLIKAKNAQNILISLDGTFFAVEPNKYQKYRFLVVKKVNNKVYLKYYSSLPDEINYKL